MLNQNVIQTVLTQAIDSLVSTALIKKQDPATTKTTSTAKPTQDKTRATLQETKLPQTTAQLIRPSQSKIKAPAEVASESRSGTSKEPDKNIPLLQEAAIHTNIDVFLLQETLASKHRPLKLKGYQAFNIPREEDVSQGCPILVKNDILCIPEPDPAFCGDGVSHKPSLSSSLTAHSLSTTYISPHTAL